MLPSGGVARRETGTDIIINGFRVALRDLIEKYRDFETPVLRGRLRAHHNALAMDGLGTFLIFSRWKKDLNFELGHQLDAFIDPAVRARTADIQRLGNDIPVLLRYPDGDMGQSPLAISSFLSRMLRWNHFFYAFASASGPSSASFFLKQFLLQ